MTLIEDIEYKISTGIRKGAKGVIASGVAWVCTWIAQKTGLDISVDHQATFVMFFTGAVIWLLNWAKVKFPTKLGWL